MKPEKISSLSIYGDWIWAGWSEWAHLRREKVDICIPVIIPLYISQVRLCGCPSQDNAGSSACLDEHLYPMNQEGQDRRWPYGACTGCSQAISFSSWGWSFVPIQNQLAISSQAELQTPPPPCVLSLPLQNEEKSQSNKTNAELT